MATMPRLIASSASSSLVQCVTGRPESAGSSQAKAMIWATASAENVSGAPERGASSKVASMSRLRCGGSSWAASNAAVASRQRSLQVWTMLSERPRRFAVGVRPRPSAAARMIRARCTSRCGALCCLSRAMSMCCCSSVTSKGVGGGPGMARKQQEKRRNKTKRTVRYLNSNLPQTSAAMY